MADEDDGLLQRRAVRPPHDAAQRGALAPDPQGDLELVAGFAPQQQRSSRGPPAQLGPQHAPGLDRAQRERPRRWRKGATSSGAVKRINLQIEERNILDAKLPEKKKFEY